jgi:hypothetical protein
MKHKQVSMEYFISTPKVPPFRKVAAGLFSSTIRGASSDKQSEILVHPGFDIYSAMIPSEPS